MTELIKALESGETHVIMAAMPHGEQTYPCARAAMLGYRAGKVIGYRAGKEAMREELEKHKAALANLCSFRDFSCLDRGVGSKTPDGAAWLTARALSMAQPASNKPETCETP